MKVKCPKCGKETEYEGNEYRPFCSARCKVIDLGDWASEKYGVPTEDSPEGIKDQDEKNDEDQD